MKLAFSLMQQPLLVAAIAALCGVCLIVLSSLWPTDVPTREAQLRAQREEAQTRRVMVYEDLRRHGVSGGSVDVAYFGDGFGLAATRHINAGDIIMRIPGAMALTANNTPSCSAMHFSRDACEMEQTIAKAVARKDLSWKGGLMTLLVLTQQRGRIKVLEHSMLSDMLEVLIDQTEEQTSNIFTIDSEEFRLLSIGTSMEGWRETALAESQAVFEFVQKSFPNAGEPTMEMVQRSYLFLHSFAQSVGPPLSDDILDLQGDVAFLWPLFLARPTPSFEHGVRISYDKTSGEYLVTSDAALRPGQEIHFVDWRLSDASALCFRGLWLSGRHRARLTLDVSSKSRDANAQPQLSELGCGAQPLSLYVESGKGVDDQFLSCMRLLILAQDAGRMQKALQQGWAQKWPHTSPLSHKDEGAAVDFAISALVQALHRIGSASAEIRQSFGTDAVAEHPTLKVREAETMLILGLLKPLKELQLVVLDDHMYEAFVHDLHGQDSSPA